MKCNTFFVLTFLGLMFAASSYFVPPTNHQNAIIYAANGIPIKKNLVQNPDFSYHTCSQDSCRWDNSNFQQNYLPGWQPYPMIEIARGNAFSSYLSPTKPVVRVGPSTNNGIAQNLGTIYGGTYTLQFEYMAIQGQAYLNTRFAVSIGNLQLGTVIVQNYNINKASAKVEFFYPINDLVLKFKGVGDSQTQKVSNGIVLLNVFFAYQGKPTSFKRQLRDDNNPEMNGSQIMGKTIAQVPIIPPVAQTPAVQAPVAQNPTPTFSDVQTPVTQAPTPTFPAPPNPPAVPELFNGLSAGFGSYPSNHGLDLLQRMNSFRNLATFNGQQPGN